MASCRRHQPSAINEPHRKPDRWAYPLNSGAYLATSATEVVRRVMIQKRLKRCAFRGVGCLQMSIFRSPAAQDFHMSVSVHWLGAR